MSKIATQKHKCGPYTFTSWLPRIGSADDKETWTATVHDVAIRGEYATLEDAMLEALLFVRADLELRAAQLSEPRIVVVRPGDPGYHGGPKDDNAYEVGELRVLNAAVKKHFPGS